MKRPLLARLLPNRLKQSLYPRWYHSRHAAWGGLFDVAPLALSPGITMHGLLPGDFISGSIAFNGFFELVLSRRIRRLAATGGLLVDVGANMGYFSLLWAGSHPSARAIAFEAAPRNVKLLENNVARNRLAGRITIVPKAASDQPGTLAFDPGPPEQTGWGGISPVFSPGTLVVPAVRLDQTLPDAPIDVLKIDVEGADTLVLRGCEALLRARRIGMIFFEENRVRMEALGIAPGEAQTFLRDLGYTCVPFEARHQEWTAYPKSRPT